MRKLISCKYHEDSQTVELPYTDETLIDTDSMAVEDKAARSMYWVNHFFCGMPVKASSK